MIGYDRVIVSVGSLDFQTQCLILARLKTKLLTEVELLVNVLHHKVQRVLLSHIVEVKRIEIVAVNQSLELNDILRRTLNFLSAALRVHCYVLAVVSTLLPQDRGRHYREWRTHYL